MSGRFKKLTTISHEQAHCIGQYHFLYLISGALVNERKCTASFSTRNHLLPAVSSVTGVLNVWERKVFTYTAFGLRMSRISDPLSHVRYDGVKLDALVRDS